jgi:signal peptidase II
MAADRGAALRGMLPWLLLAAAVVLADQLAKAQVQALLAQPGAALPVTSFFALVLAYNTGAAFSLLNDAGGWQGPLFMAVAAAASALIVWLIAGHWRQRLMACALALVLGGALGNLIDRLHHGHVVDFLDFHWTWLGWLFPGGHFPAFNLADSAICLGAGLLILEEVLRSLRRPRA